MLPAIRNRGYTNKARLRGLLEKGSLTQDLVLVRTGGLRVYRRGFNRQVRFEFLSPIWYQISNGMAQLQRLAIAPSQVHNQFIDLTAEQQHYLGRVLRLGGGDRFIAMDGQGHWWLAQQSATDTRSALILEEIAVQNELPIEVVLIAALPKGNSFDEVVRQVTELGIYSIIPVVSDRTLLKPSPQKVERWRRIATEAAEQSERQIVPTILEPVPFTLGLQDCTQDRRFICVTRRESPHLLDCLETDLTEFKTFQSIVIAIGPEGGWTEEEIESAIAANFQPVSLGCRILRAVTAPIVALSLVAAAFEKKKN